MGNERALHLGMGNLRDVTNAVTQLPSGDESIRMALTQLAAILETFPPDHSYRGNVNAILAAFFNQRSAVHHWIYSADEHNEISREWFPTKQTREMMLDIMGIS